ncbi:MAG: hypothetical protein J4F36_13995 [Nitrosopumilaceae archaeon]|nr:hypothetical protein [Nitrosopumilaceae archaeon]
MSSEDWIIEKHISTKALPNENIISWIKWNASLIPESITLKYDPDLMLQKILNVSVDGINSAIQETGKITLDQRHFQIPGFFGFTGFYKELPEDEKTINFIVEFNFANDVKVVEYYTKIIRPILVFEQNEYTLTSTNYTNALPSLDFKLVNSGLGRAVDLSPFVEITNTSDMQIQIQTKTEEIKDESLVFVKTSTISIPKFIVQGKGYGMVSIGFKYKDTVGNVYKSPLSTLSIQIEETQTLQVPITENISTLPIPLLQAVS